ncbi:MULTISPECIES: mycoredoxin [unclassified Corynebacterium]|uniref:mycoredoxin n=1 Tax=unclassified Corynebacterium TaxID=2624378 RepID=UPI0030A7421B
MTNSAATPKTTEHVTIYATSWCPFCQRLLANLDKSKTPFEAWDVEKHADLAAWVESVNDGNRIVPTVLYSDGTYATNPSAREVEAKYAELAQ